MKSLFPGQGSPVFSRQTCVTPVFLFPAGLSPQSGPLSLRACPLLLWARLQSLNSAPVFTFLLLLGSPFDPAPGGCHSSWHCRLYRQLPQFMILAFALTPSPVYCSAHSQQPQSQTLVNTSVLILNSPVSNTNFNIFRPGRATSWAGFLHLDFQPLKRQSTLEESNRTHYSKLKNKDFFTQLWAKIHVTITKII